MKTEVVNKWYVEWKVELSKYKYFILLSLIFLFLAERLNFYASSYVDRLPSIAVKDLILNNIPTLNLWIIFIYGPFLFFSLIILYTLFFRVKEFHKVAILFSLLIFVRSIFITLTHIGAPTDASVANANYGFFNFFTFKNDLFFSGHVAMPFMAFLIFRKEAIGKIFLALTIISALTVLFMHVHYSIDVFSAFFITYGVYSFGQWLLNKDIFNKTNI